MAKPILSKKKAHILSFALFLIGLALIIYFNYWWPGIMLALGIPLALRQYLLGRRLDMIISLVVFLGAFIVIQFKIQWEIILPVLLTVGAIYIFFKEFFGPKEIDEAEEEEELNKEIEEDEEHHS